MSSIDKSADQKYAEQSVREIGYLVDNYRDFLSNMQSNSVDSATIADDATVATLGSLANRANAAKEIIGIFADNEGNLQAVYDAIHQRLWELYYYDHSVNRAFIDVFRSTNIKLSLHIKEQ
jgi:hypothetical protein